MNEERNKASDEGKKKTIKLREAMAERNFHQRKLHG